MGIVSGFLLGGYPNTRLRRNRRDDWSRRLVAENVLTAADLIWPVFIEDGDGRPTPIASMPGVDRLPIAQLIDAAGAAAELGIPVVALFPATDPRRKSETGDEAWNEDNLICRATAALKRQVPGIGVLCDVALDPYTTHGHDGNACYATWRSTPTPRMAMTAFCTAIMSRMTRRSRCWFGRRWPRRAPAATYWRRPI